MTAQEEYKDLLSQLSEKESTYKRLVEEEEALVRSIRLLSFKKNSILDLLASDKPESLDREAQLQRLSKLENVDVKRVVQYLNKDLKIADLDLDPVLLYSMWNEDI